MKGYSNFRIRRSTGTRATRPQTPRMRPTFAMFDPTTLATAISAEPRSEAASDTDSSGMDVPAATTVSPMTEGVRRARRASAAANSTRRSPEKARIATPAAIMARARAKTG